MVKSAIHAITPVISPLYASIIMFRSLFVLVVKDSSYEGRNWMEMNLYTIYTTLSFAPFQLFLILFLFLPPASAARGPSFFDIPCKWQPAIERKNGHRRSFGRQLILAAVALEISFLLPRAVFNRGERLIVRSEIIANRLNYLLINVPKNTNNVSNSFRKITHEWEKNFTRNNRK